MEKYRKQKEQSVRQRFSGVDKIPCVRQNDIVSRNWKIEQTTAALSLYTYGITEHFLELVRGKILV